MLGRIKAKNAKISLSLFIRWLLQFNVTPIFIKTKKSRRFKGKNAPRQNFLRSKLEVLQQFEKTSKKAKKQPIFRL